jgi:hypothetical protein
MATSRKTKILVISAARHLAGHDVEEVLDHQWSPSNVPNDVSARFDNVGFNLKVNDHETTLKELRRTLSDTEWDGILVGWCIRGHAELTELFEPIINTCVDHVVEKRAGPGGPRLYFCSGPDDIVNATLRNFPSSPA